MEEQAKPASRTAGGGGLLSDPDLRRSMVRAAGTAVLPLAREATEAAAGWVAARWPEFTRETLLPAVAKAVAPDERDRPPTSGRPEANGSPRGPADAGRMLTLLAGAAAAGAAAAAYLRR